MNTIKNKFRIISPMVNVPTNEAIAGMKIRAFDLNFLFLIMLFFIIAPSVFTSGFSQEQLMADLHNVPVANTNIEEDHIKAVLKKESISYSKGDIKAWASCYVHSPKTTYIGKDMNGNTIKKVGFDTIEALIKGWISHISDQEYQHNETKDWNISINGNTAWCSYVEFSKVGDKSYTIQDIRVLEKVNGEWKIALVCFLY